MGKVFKYGDNVDTDVIIPARYLNVYEPSELSKHCMEDIDASFAITVKAGDIIVAGDNFGSGSSREHAPLAIKACGVYLVLAKSFARIFYRNAINIGLPILECREGVEKCESGDELTVDFKTGEIKNITKNETYKANPFPDFIAELINDGGLIEHILKRGAI